ncbi:MAG: hypothetical protein M1830_000311, partial [Pleopsidium flavum]
MASFMTRGDGQDVLIGWDWGEFTDANFQTLAPIPKHQQSECKHDNVPSVTNLQLRSLLNIYPQVRNGTLYTTDPVRAPFVDPSSPIKKGCDIRRMSDLSLEALLVTISTVHVVSSSTGDTTGKNSSTTSRGQTTTASDGLAANYGNIRNAQGARSGSGDGADEPDDPGRRKPLRSHETET